jgi:small subunit ribosomal protein S21
MARYATVGCDPYLCHDAACTSTSPFDITAGSKRRKKLTTVILKPNEPVEVALRRFRRAIERTGLIPELRARTAYEKPTAERKRKKAAAVARLRKQIKRSLPPKKRY